MMDSAMRVSEGLAMTIPQSTIDYERQAPIEADRGFGYYCLMFYVYWLICGGGFLMFMVWGVSRWVEVLRGFKTTLPMVTMWSVEFSQWLSNFWMFLACLGMLL